MIRLLLLLLAVCCGFGTHAQPFNPVNNYLVSGYGYAFRPVADTGMGRARIKLKTLENFRKKKATQPEHSTGDVAAIETLFRASAFEACLEEINHSPMVGSAFRQDSTRMLFRRDRFHATAGPYDTANSNLLVYLWCQGLTWTMKLNAVAEEQADGLARLIDRTTFYTSLANWGFIGGNLAPLAFATDESFRLGAETFRVPDGQSQPIAFRLQELLPDTRLPDVSFDYDTEVAAYLAGLQPVVSKTGAARVVERLPSFKGNILKYIAGEMQYPQDAREDRIEGLLVMRFVVTETGAVTDIEIERGTGYESLDREGVRILQQMPLWKPGLQRDEKGVMQPVKVYYRMPVSFTLN